jgi:hypothetical protein
VNTPSVLRISGLAGVLVGVLGLVTVPLYFIYSGPPPAWNVLTRNLVTLLAVAGVLVFMSGFRHLLRTAGAGLEWPADLAYGCSLVYAALVLVAASLETGPAIADPGDRIDPTTTGPLAAGDILLHGSANRTVVAVLMLAAGFAIVRSRVLPRWVGVIAFVVAAANVACIPSLFFGPDAARFYSALGWGNSALTASLICYWTGLGGIAMMRAGRRPLPAAS